MSIYHWSLTTAAKLAEANFLSSVQITYDNRFQKPYRLRFMTRCGDLAQLVTSHTQQEKRKVRSFTTRNSVLRFINSKLPNTEGLLNDEVEVTRYEQ